MLLALLPRLIARRAFALTAVFAVTAAVLAQTPSAADGFDPNVDGNVFALAQQADGKLLVGGLFTAINGVERSNLARLNPDGTVDASFNPSPNGAVRAIAIQSDERIVFGGDFTEVQPNRTGAAATRSRIARVNAAGALDATFNPNVSLVVSGATFRSQVAALLLQPNGQLVVGGSFNTVQPGGTGAAVTRNNLARFNADGSLDAAFNPNANAMVLALALHVDNKLLVGGGFTSIGGDTRNRIARLNVSGSLDSEFNPNANNGVTSIAVQRDGKVLLGGFFTTLQPIGEASPANRTHLARLNANGSIDSEFYPRAEGNVSTVAVQPDGGILIGGTFSAVWGRGASSAMRNFLARFNPDGSVDDEFAPVLNGEVTAFAFPADGQIVVGGHFTRVQPPGAGTAVVRNRLARFGLNGALDTNFALDPGGRVLVSVVQTDGRVVIGGTFTSVGGATHNYLARLNADGTVDATYNPDLNGRVYTMAYEAATNKVIVGGAFTTIGGETRNRLARLNPNGTIDSEFNPGIDGQVGVILLQPDNRILVGGTFSSVTPARAAASTSRSNLLRLNNDGTLDTAFDPSPNSSVSALALQSDNKILVGGLFSAFTPGFAANTSATTTTRGFIARLNADGTLDTAFAPNTNGQVTSIAAQSDGKVVIGGGFTAVAPAGAAEGTPRNHLARLNADGTLDAAYDPNANGTVLALALQSDGKLLVGGAFTTLQPNGRSDWILRKYFARLNADGTVDDNYNLDLSEQPGNRVDSIRVLADGRVLLGGSFTSLQPAGTPTRIARRNFARLAASGAVDLAFDPGTGGSTGAIVNGLAVQADGKVIAVGSFADLGGAKSTNIARFRPEGTPDPEFSGSLASDGPVNAVAVRPNSTATPSQLGGFAWLNANGTLRSGFSTGTTRLSGSVNAIAFDAGGRLLLGGAFTNLDNTTGGNLVRLNANGSLDTSFNPNVNGAITGIAIQPDGRILVVGTFTAVGTTVRNRIARIDPNGALDVTYDPNANGRINAIVLQADGAAVVGGAFTSFTPNLATTAVTRNYIARINGDGTVDPNYNPTPNFNVNALALQADGKVIAGGAFSNVQPNGGATAFNRSAIARFNGDGTVDQNFDPTANAPVNALVALPNGQILVGGAFTALQPTINGTATAQVTRNNLARINSDGAVDASFNPNPNGAVTSLAVQPDGQILAGGTFTTLQANATGASISRNGFARVAANGALDPNFNPDVNGGIATIVARPDGTVVIGGGFTELQLNGSIVIGGSFATIGGVAARNLAMLNENGSVNANFQPRPDGAVNALLVQPDGKVVVGGAFTNIAGAARNRLARFNADGTLDATFAGASENTVNGLALQDGKLLVGSSSSGNAGSSTGIVRLNADGSRDTTFAAMTGDLGLHTFAVQADGKIVYAAPASGLSVMIARLERDGAADPSFAAAGVTEQRVRQFAIQADGKILVASSAAVSRPFLTRLNANGSLDSSFNPMPNGSVTAIALQSDGRVVIGGGFNSVAGQPRVGIARVSNTGPAIQVLGVAANRSSVTWTRGGTVGEISAAIFEISTDRMTWTRLGEGARVAGTSNWQLTGLNLPATGLFYIRARGIAPAGTSSGIYESMREFTFSSPLPQGSGPTVVSVAGSITGVFDPTTGIAARAALVTVPGEGTVEILVSSVTRTPANPRPARLANLSTRGRVAADSPLILGFAIAGDEPRRVLVRGIGPALGGFGVSGALAATRLQIYDASGAVLASNEGWGNATDLAQTAAATGAFPLTAGSADSAALLTLAPGNYTIQVVDPRGAGGIALAEIYDAGTSAGSRLVNVSSRASAGAGADALISGFVIAGDATERVLLRGVGPGLAKFGATGVVADPTVTLYDARGLELGSNDNWVSSLSTVTSATASAGAFALDAGSKDAAVLATLPAGTYTIQVTAPTRGAALLEIYEVR